MDAVNNSKIQRATGGVNEKIEAVVELAEEFSLRMGGPDTLPPAVLGVLLALVGAKLKKDDPRIPGEQDDAFTE